MAAGDTTYLHQIITESVHALESIRTLEGAILDATSLLASCLKYGHKVMACGNGGSAADASHFTTELLCRFEGDRRSLPAVSLTADGSFLTAAGNDYGFDRVFSRQVEGLGCPGDVLVVFSTSGNSANVIEALKAAKARKVKTIAVLGRDGGDAQGIADVELIIPDPSTARIQEAQQLVIHLLCGLVERRLFRPKR